MSTVSLLVLFAVAFVGITVYFLQKKDDEVKNEPKTTTPEEVLNHVETPIIEEEPIIVVEEVVVKPKPRPKRKPNNGPKKTTGPKKPTTK